MTIGDALTELSKHHYLSAPVVLAASVEDQESDTFLGIVDSACAGGTAVTVCRR